MESWAEEEVATGVFGDSRLARRLMRTLEALASHPASSVPQACGSWAATKGAYRFWSSERVTPEAIRASHARSTQARIHGPRRVLVIQDTTELDFTHHPKTRGLGYLSATTHSGLRVHSSMVVSVEGVPQGRIHQQVWTRDPATKGKSEQRHRRKTSEKESQRWLTACEAIQDAVGEDTEAVIVADQEADMYDLFAIPLRRGVFLLIRGRHNRRVTAETKSLCETVRQASPCAKLVVSVSHRDGQPPRQATVSIRAASVEICPPCGRPRAEHVGPIRIQVILTEELEPPSGVTPLSWLLLTTLPVQGWQDAVRCVQWYALRWLIERYHYVLKSGCQVEQLQLETADRLHRALATYCLATYCIVACRLLWASYQARATPDASCEGILTSEEWQTLYCIVHKTTALPNAPPTMREAVRGIAQLGGFLARRSDGEPGVKCLWRGWRRLQDMLQVWQLLRH